MLESSTALKRSISPSFFTPKSAENVFFLKDFLSPVDHQNIGQKAFNKFSLFYQVV
jgi:hypothetical protein